MPISFKNTHSAPDPSMDAKHLTDWVRNKFNLPSDVAISVGMSVTAVRLGKVSMTLPFGVKDVKNNAALPSTLSDYAKIAGGAPAPVMLGGSPAKNHVPITSDLPEEMWADAVAEALFPGHQPLHVCQQLYQTVPGTSSKSVYRTAFIGPNLKGACRIKSTSVSFRFTTDQATAPTGAVKAALLHLGIDTEYTDRLTGHAHLAAPVTSDPAPTRALFGAFYGALRPYLTSPFPDLNKFTEGTK